MVIRKKLTGATVVGLPGTGKTHAIAEVIREKLGDPEDYIRNSHASPRGMFELLYEFRNKPLLVLDDMDAIFSDDTVNNLLKSALWGVEERGGRKKRMVSWSSSFGQTRSKSRSPLPPQFEFRSGVILVGNRFPSKKDAFMAVMTRMPRIRFEISDRAVFDFMEEMARGGYAIFDEESEENIKLTEAECREVVSFLRQHQMPNLRSFQHGLIFFLEKQGSDDWKRLLRRTMETRSSLSPRGRFLEVFNDLSLRTNERVALAERELGVSKSTFHRWGRIIREQGEDAFLNA